MTLSHQLITCDLVCMGVASPEAFRMYINWLQEEEDATLIDYRHRGYGEPWGTYLERASFDNGKVEYATDRTNAWKRTWNKYLLRPSCYNCGYHSTERPGNLTIGDYWGLSSAHRGTYDSKGVSCLLVNDSTGAEVFSLLAEKIVALRSSLELCTNPEQPMLVRPPKKNAYRDSFFAAMRKDGFRQACRSVNALGWKRNTKDLVKVLLKKIWVKLQPGNRSDLFSDCFINEKDDVAFPLVYAAKHVSNDIRKNSSSGGIFHALAELVIDNNGVVYGCAFDETFEAMHIRCETIEECERCMGSKYSQSNMGETISSIQRDLKEGRVVLFTGTPCQVDAVRRVCE